MNHQTQLVRLFPAAPSSENTHLLELASERAEFCGAIRYNAVQCMNDQTLRLLPAVPLTETTHLLGVAGERAQRLGHRVSLLLLAGLYRGRHLGQVLRYNAVQCGILRRNRESIRCLWGLV